MSEVIGKGVIEVSADATKLKAGIDEAKKSLKGLGEAGKNATDKASASIDKYVQRLQSQGATLGKSTREAELYKLGLRGASAEQLKSADAALRMSEQYEKSVRTQQAVRVGMVAIAAAATATTAALFAGLQHQLEQIAGYQNLAEKIGDTAEAVASIKPAADVSGVALDSVAAASIKLTAALSKTDDEGKNAGAALRALGIDFNQFKALSPVDQLEAVSKAMEGFADGSEKTAIAVALFGKSGAELIPFLNDLASGSERQVRLTNEQIKAADQYSKAQARLRSEFETFLQLQAVETLPVLQGVNDLFRSIATDGEQLAVVSDLIKGAMSGAVNVFQTVAVVASDVGFVFTGIGREIGAIAAQLVALASLDFSGFKAISEAVKEDGERAKKELDKFQARIMKIGQPQYIDDEVRRLQKRSAATSDTKKKIDTSGLSNEQEAKARLELEISRIRAAGAAMANAFDGAEKIMEAHRSAALVDDYEYYEAKREFINLNTQAQEAALQKEIALLQRQQASGKDKVENDKKISEAQAKLAKVRADSVISLEVLSVQENAAASRLQQYYRDANDAASQYLETLRRTQQLELQGMGAGNAARQRLAGRAQIDDKYTQQLRELEKSRRDSEFSGTFGAEARAKYEFELDLIRKFRASALKEYESYYDTRRAMEEDWRVGASEGLNNYLEQVRNVAAATENLVGNAFRGMEDALVEFVKTGKLDFASLADSIITDLIRIQVQQSITGPLAGKLAGLFSNGSGGFGTGSSYGNQDYGLNFEGGGFTGSGVRSGGLDGKGGFMAMLHPQETVIDHTRGQSSGSQITYAPVIQIDSRTDRREIAELVDRSLRSNNAQLIDQMKRQGRI